MPEPYRFIGRTYKHYDDDELNYGYVYIPNNAYVLEKDFRQAFGNYADMFGQSTVTVDFSAESTQTTLETPPSDVGHCTG